MGIALMLVLNIKFKWNSMLALLLAAVIVALANGLTPSAALDSITKGFGSTLGSLAIIVVFGAIIGKLMVDSGASHVLASTLIDKFGVRFIRVAVAIIGVIFGIAMFYEVAFLMLAPLVISIAREAKISWLSLAVTGVAAATVAHSIFPPQPGPVALIEAYHSDYGTVYLLGILMVICMIAVGGFLYPRLLHKWSGMTGRPVPNFMRKDEDVVIDNPPSFAVSLFVPLSPALIMIAVTICNVFVDKESTLGQWLNFFGSSQVAMAIALLLAFVLFGTRQGHDMNWNMERFNSGVSSIAGVIMIIGAGGAFKQVVLDSGVGDYIGGLMTAGAVSPYIMAWLIAVIIRLATGQGVVAAMTAAGIIVGAVTDPATGMIISTINPALLTLATACGANFLTHINDASFWLFKSILISRSRKRSLRGAGCLQPGPSPVSPMSWSARSSYKRRLIAHRKTRGVKPGSSGSELQSKVINL
ncbi:gluconate:H+ symporter [Actinobaculum suis]|uniref:gluconate:H+ symporter n=2 Tax=Actinobaculum suis TaxID=1657 RepID=UPI0021001F4C|nr:gluconate:H+ symporter [Actinobaculum suis]